MANRLRARRLALNLTQPQVSSHLKTVDIRIEAGMVSRYENGICLPTAQQIEVLERVLQAPRGELFDPGDLTLLGECCAPVSPPPQGENFSVYGSREEWLEARRDGLGASDAAAVLGVSPWKSNEALWEEKTGLVAPEDIGDKPYVRYGNDAEPFLRALFALDHPEYEASFTPYKVCRHPDKPFITCTPDGELMERATGRRGGLEIKTTEIMSAGGWEKWNGRVPDEYYAQVCHQMLAAGWEFVELLAQIKYTTADGDDRKETRHYLFERTDAQEDIALLEREETAFWVLVTERRRPNLKILLPAAPRLK